MIKNIYFNLKKTEEFQEYMHSSEEGFDFDKEFITKIFSKFLLEDEHFQHLLAEKNIYWDDDLPLSVAWF